MSENSNSAPETDANTALPPPPPTGQPGRGTATFHFTFSGHPNAPTNGLPQPNGTNTGGNPNGVQGANFPMGSIGLDEVRHRIHIRAPPGVSVNFNGRGVPVAAAGGRGRFVFRGVQPGRGGPIPATVMNGIRSNPHNLPKLQPQILPESQQEMKPHDDDSQSDGGHHYSPFKCAICFENMHDPSGCGNCSARFCYDCLKRVAELSARQQQLPNHQQHAAPKCPVCRSSIDGIEDIQRDGELKRRMDELPPVPCRYRGCQEMLKVSQVAQHEAAMCSFVRMQCRYQPYGCTWTGKRADLQQHEQEDCHLARISQVVERYRQLQLELASLAHGMAHLHQNFVTNNAVMELQRSRDNEQYSPGNIFHLVQFIHSLTCCTVRFLASRREAWVAFYDPNGKATVANFLTCLPTNILILKTLAASYRLLLVASQSMETDEDLVDLLDAFLYFLFATLLVAVIGLCFYGDGYPEKWSLLRIQVPQTIFNAPGDTRETQLLLYSVTFAMASLHTIALEISGSVLRASLLWVCICATTTVFPALVTGMSSNIPSNNELPNNENILQLLHLGRAAKPLWVGLCYAPCSVAFGIMPSIDAAVTLFLAQDTLNRFLPFGILPVGDLLAQFPLPALYVYGGARLAMRATEFPTISWIYTIDFLIVAMFVIVAKMVLWMNFKAGTRIGIRIAQQSGLRTNPAPPTIRAEYHGLGVFFFSMWCLLLGAIVIT